MKLSRRLLTSAVAITAGFAASHIVKLIWRGLSGHKAPEDAEDLDLSTVQVTVFAATLAAAVVAAQTLATRCALTAWRRSEVKDLRE
ncbi:MAG: DUF4235 domain-containing protein [Bifidobacteriaceae bacterium]|jgi:hypothetical protein|nr:DUF4235 domain-containing protein [Bifidobacteriaceae bacterium]